MEMLEMFFAPMREELVRLGFRELRTPEEVDQAMAEAGPDTSTLVVINSMCGCAGGVARPAVAMALQHTTVPDRCLTVFASQDREATARMRQYFPDQPPSSPSIALLKGRQLVHMVHRSDIENRTAEEVADHLKAVFDRYCR